MRVRCSLIRLADLLYPHPQAISAGVPIAIVAYFLVAGLLAVHHARNKRFVEHR